MDRLGAPRSLVIDSDDRDPRLILEASGAVVRMAQNRPLFMALLGGSLALHAFLFLLLSLIEKSSAPHPDRMIEIPVELVSETEANGGADKEEAKASAAQTGTARPEEARAAKPAPDKQAEAQSKSQEAAQPQQPKPKPESEPPKPAPPAAEGRPILKPAEAQPNKPTFAETQTPKPPLPAPMQAQTPPPKPQPAQTSPTMAALQPADAGHRPAQSPYAIMEDPWQAVAVPTPSESGDMAMSYKTIVFGMLELAKQFPKDARARGAHGTALVYFELDDQGELKSAKILRSSGDTELDVESLAIIARAAPFPQPPPGAQKAFAASVEFDHDP